MPTHIPIKNTNQRNQIKVTKEVLETDPKTKKSEWKNSIVTYLKPGEGFDAWVAANQRYTITEMPT